MGSPGSAETMLAMEVDPQARGLVSVRRAIPACEAGDIRVRVRACGVCRTDLHVIDAELTPHRAHVIPGHEIVGEVVARGRLATRFAMGQRVGIPWLGGTCGTCHFCKLHRENLCDTPVFTGYDRDGGYAEYACADERFCFNLPDSYDDVHAAPLLCAGLIGFRTWRSAGAHLPENIGIWGFGAAAHIVCQLATAHGQQVFAFTRPGDTAKQEFALRLGAVWAGGTDEYPPVPMDAQLIFAPHGSLVPRALESVRKGGCVVCGGIHMSDIPSLPYAAIWGERELKSVANLTRADGEAFFGLLQSIRVTTQVHEYPLSEANAAVQAVRDGALEGAAVLIPERTAKLTRTG